MATGSSGPAGFWLATLMVPPGVPVPLPADVPPLVAALPPPPAVVSLLPPAPLPQALMMALMKGSDSPINVPRRTNSRRLTEPFAYDSTRSSSSGPACRRARSNARKSMDVLPLGRSEGSLRACPRCDYRHACGGRLRPSPGHMYR